VTIHFEHFLTLILKRSSVKNLSNKILFQTL